MVRIIDIRNVLEAIRKTFSRMLTAPCLFILSLALASCSKGSERGTMPANPPTNNNPGQNGNDVIKDLFQADPTIYEEDGIFYLYGTNDEDPNTGFQVYTSTDMKTWVGPKGYRSGYALSKIENYGNQGFWAPQVWKEAGKYFMAYTADEHVAISTSDSPTGPFVQPGKRTLFTGTKKQIDPFVFKDDDGRTYLFYVDISNGNKIFVTELADDLMSVKDETGVECIRVTEDWEDSGQPSAMVTEGPTVLKHKGAYYLLYSANHFANPNYAVGYAVSKSAKGPWQKYQGNPILSRNKVNWSGTGHGDLVWRKDGSVYEDSDGSMYYVFHTHFSEGGARTTPRKTAIVKMRFKSDGDAPDLLGIDAASFRHLSVNE